MTKQQELDASYVKHFIPLLRRSDRLLDFDAKRVAGVFDEDELVSVTRCAASVGRWVDTFREARGGVVESVEPRRRKRKSAVELKPLSAATPAVLAYLESSQKLQDARYLHSFWGTFCKSDDFLLFDPDRLARLLDDDQAGHVIWYAAQLVGWLEEVRRHSEGDAQVIPFRPKAR